MAKLRRLTLKNFKSFRTAVIPFALGFTAIMGPNGSGKSNIIDALIFVLGEGRLKLVRANRLKDLVNVRSRDGEAVVSLEIEEGDKVYTLTRSINRRGQSVYRLNGRRVTRHEVLTLLSSMGISQRGYNFVLQGEITRLIRMSPQERRQIIDEIAGISEYEEKKEEALKKLDEVSARIKEVSIVLGEREEQLRRLEKEKRDAERYLELRRFVSSLRKGILLLRIRELREKRNLLERTVEEERRSLEELKKERVRLEDEISSLEEKNIELTRRISELYAEAGEDRYRELLGEKERREAEIRHIKEELRDLEVREAALIREVEELEIALGEQERELRSSIERKQEKDREVNELRKRIRSLEEIVKREQEEGYVLQRRLEELESKIESLKSEYIKVREEYGRVSGEYNARVEEMKRQREKIEKKAREREKIKEELARVESRIKDLEEERNNLLERERYLNREYLAVQEEIKEIREEIGALKGASMALRSLGISMDVLDALLEAQRRGELRGIKGFVASLIRYNKKYRRALEAAAGRKLFYIVVETAIDASEAIKYLKREGLGRATFIPLDRIRPHLVEVPQRKGVLGRALDLVEYDPTLSRAMEYVFGDTLVVENIDIARELEGYRSVTLDGDIVERSGVMSGGSVRGESVLSVFEAEKKRALLREKERSLRDIVENLKVIRKRIEEVDRELRDLSGKRERLRVRIEEEAQQPDSTSLEPLKERMEELIKRMTEITNQISDLEMERSKLLSQIKKTGSETLNRMNELRREYEAKLRELHDYLSLVRERQASVERTKERLHEKRGMLEALDGKRASLQERLTALEKEVEELSGEIRKVEERVKERQKELMEAVEEKEELDRRIKELSRKLGVLNERISEADRKVVSLERDLASIRAKLSELEREYDEIDTEPIDDLPPEPERVLRDALDEMASLEPVNLRAIQEYDEMKEKVEEVKEKVSRLEEERRAILAMIEEIEKKKREVFMSTFREISRKFAEVYRELTGGKARLRLTDEDNVFEAGLLIEATPKGKSLTHMDALSGGEKAMVALAFIFATALHRPAPFYVLDEPDLMLDKVNAEKMAKYIKGLSRNAQFIVVSHRDVVLKEADQIIGVYLGNDGSSVVEVRVPQPSQASSLAG